MVSLMRSVCSLCRVAALAIFGVGALAGDEPLRRDPAATVMRVVLVDTGVKAPWRDELNRVLRENLCAALVQQAGGAVTVQTELLEAKAATVRVSRGGCDALLILGSDRPPVLRRLALPLRVGNLGVERNREPVYLMIASTDPQLRQWIEAVFPKALAGPTRAMAWRAGDATATPGRALAADRAATSETPASRRGD